MEVGHPQLIFASLLAVGSAYRKPLQKYGGKYREMRCSGLLTFLSPRLRLHDSFGGTNIAVEFLRNAQTSACFENRWLQTQNVGEKKPKKNQYLYSSSNNEKNVKDDWKLT